MIRLLVCLFCFMLGAVFGAALLAAINGWGDD